MGPSLVFLAEKGVLGGGCSPAPYPSFPYRRSFPDSLGCRESVAEDALQNFPVSRKIYRETWLQSPPYPGRFVTFVNEFRNLSSIARSALVPKTGNYRDFKPAKADICQNKSSPQ
jgi:hypothetical protein